MADLEANRFSNGQYDLPRYADSNRQTGSASHLTEADIEEENRRLEEAYQENINTLLNSIGTTKIVSQNITRQIEDQIDVIEETDRHVTAANRNIANNTNSLHSIVNSPGSDWKIKAIVIALIFILVVLLIS